MTKIRSFGASRGAAALVAVLSIALSVVPAAGADTKTELREARRELGALVDRIEERTAEVNALQAEVAVIAADINRVEAEIARTRAAIIELQQDIEVANEEMGLLQDQLDERARIAYQIGPGTALELFLGSTSLADLTARLEIIDSVADSDRALIDEIRNRRAALEQQHLEQRRLRARQRAEQARLEQRRAAMQSKLDQANALLAGLNDDRARAERLVNHLEKRLQAEIREAARLAALERVRSGGSVAGAVGRPFKICPVDPPRGYSNDFGAPRYTGGYHPHAGNDIFAPLGTPVRAPFAGNATEASNGIGGLAVKVTGPDGYVYNAHLSSFGALGPVSAGTVIGYVGNTGNAQSTPPHNHFEWHPRNVPAGVQSYNGAINPYPYLNQVC